MKKFLLIALAAAALILGTIASAQTQINQANISSFPYVITQPGSYILTSNLTVDSSNDTAIYISASGVVLNLNGFSIHGATVCTTTSCSSSTLTYGVYSNLPGNTVENGNINGFYYGVYVVNGIVKDLTVSSVYVGVYGSFTNIHNNSINTSAGYGIYSNMGTVSNNTITSVAYYGIYGYEATVINNNVSYSKMDGIFMSSGLASGNSIVASTTTNLTLYGGAVGSNNSCTSGPC